MALFRSARGRARSEREFKRNAPTVDAHLGDVIGDPGPVVPRSPPRRYEDERCWTDVTVSLIFTILIVFGIVTLAVIAIAMVVIGMVAMHVRLIPPAAARDLGQYAQVSPEIRQWFNGLRSGKGNCCSMADGRSITDADTDIRGNHFWVRVDGEWIEVPDEALVAQPNRIGNPVVWPMKDADGKTAIRCFLPGAGA